MSEEGNLFIMAWDCNGLEAVVNITEYEKDGRVSCEETRGLKEEISFY